VLNLRETQESLSQRTDDDQLAKDLVSAGKSFQFVFSLLQEEKEKRAKGVMDAENKLAQLQDKLDKANVIIREQQEAISKLSNEVEKLVAELEKVKQDHAGKMEVKDRKISNLKSILKRQKTMDEAHNKADAEVAMLISLGPLQKWLWSVNPLWGKPV